MPPMMRAERRGQRLKNIHPVILLVRYSVMLSAMRRTPLFLAPLLLVPAAAFALDFTDVSRQFNDAPFPKPEAAGISLLKNMGVVEGNPDGTFRPNRSLNRAEFAKIVVALRGDVQVQGFTANCFPDVTDQWFAAPICTLKDAKVVAGNPDGLFHPERSVNYAEALKMLANVFAYDVKPGSGDRWYLPYANAAEDRGTALPVSLAYDAALTRGQMARLAAAFAAEDAGELDLYRAAERGQTVKSSSSSSSSSSAAVSAPSSSSSSSSISSSSSSSSAASVLGRAKNAILLLGKETPVVADGTFLSDEADADVQIVTVMLRREVRSIDRMFLVDAAGKKAIELTVATDDPEKRRWKGNASASGTVKLPKNAPTVLGLVFTLKARDQGSPGELVEFERFNVTATLGTGVSREFAPTEKVFPTHQVAQATLQTIQSTLPNTGFLQPGTQRRIAAFRFSGAILAGAQLKISEVNLRVESSGVTVTNWRIGGANEVEQADCGIDAGNMTLLTCPLIPDFVNTLAAGSGRVLSIYGNVAAGDNIASPSLRLSIEAGGTVAGGGFVRWTDGTSNFTWIDSPQVFPVRGTMWTVAK